MCSIGDEDFGDEGGAHTMSADPKPPASVIVSDEICKKCHEHKVAVKLDLKDAQCESCFYQYVRHKMRASMGSTKIIERGAKVLLVFDGTIESCVLFDMVRHAVSLEQFKRLTIKPNAIYVDNSCIHGLLHNQRQEKLAETLRIVETFGFELFYTSIGSEKPAIKFDGIHVADEYLTIEEDFMKKFSAIGNQTAKEDYLNIRHLNICRKVAAQIGSKYVFMPTVSHQVATTLLVNVALGRCKSVANDISFCDNRSNCAAKIIRPMRNITSLEIETYFRLDKTLNEFIHNNNYFDGSRATSSNSIQNLTKQFIDNLQENFASTVSTVFRTGDKISAAATVQQTNDAQPKQTCKFCHSDLDYEGSSTLFAIEYSRCVSACADQKEVNDVELMLKKAENQVLGKLNDETSNLIPFLCHGCRNIFRNLDDPETFIH